MMKKTAFMILTILTVLLVGCAGKMTNAPVPYGPVPTARQLAIPYPWQTKSHVPSSPR